MIHGESWRLVFKSILWVKKYNRTYSYRKEVNAIVKKII